MRLTDVLQAECVVVNAELHDKAAALIEVARAARRSPALKDVDEAEILNGLKERESLGSTGFGNGIAIPHCRLKSVSDFVVGLITVPAGVDFEALDRKEVKLIVFIVAPEGRPNENVRLLSAVSQTLLVPGAVKEMLAENTTEAVRESFLRHTRADIDSKDRASKNMVHVFVQDESVFHDIVAVLAAAESSSLVIIDGEHTGTYLANMPLFAGFWRDKPGGFNRIVIAVVEKKLTNETMRRIESVTGNLDERTGVLVTVQDISYLAGSLDAQA